MAALAQNGDGLRADQAGAADDDDLHDLPSLVDDLRPSNGFECKATHRRPRIFDWQEARVGCDPLVTTGGGLLAGVRGLL